MLPRASTRICTLCKIHDCVQSENYHRRSTTVTTSHNPSDLAKWKIIFETYRSQNKLTNQDWHDLSSNLLDKDSSKILRNHFNGSLYSAVRTLYPETEWYPWKFQDSNVPSGFWKNLDNQRKFFEDLAFKLGVKTLDDWYTKLSLKNISTHGGAAMLKLYNGSPMEALIANYPEHDWKPWLFKNTTHHFWKSMENRRRFFEWLAKQLGVTKMEDWYSVLSKRALHENGGATLIETYYQGSAMKALQDIYPEHKWLPWKFRMTTKGFWKSLENRRKFFDWLGSQLGVQSLDDWYKLLHTKTVYKNGGTFVALYYKGSCVEALMDCYPEHTWFPWKFETSVHRLWSSEETVAVYLAELSEKLSISTLDDWYRVDWIQLQQFGANSAFQQLGGLYKVLKKQYPDHPWDPKKFFGAKKAQRWLIVSVKKLFPNEEIIEDYVHPKAVFQVSKRPIRLDAFLPSKSLALEYQGQQHFTDLAIFEPAKMYQQRDQEKRELCKQHNILLVEVPYWWNRTPESLQDMIDSAKAKQ